MGNSQQKSENVCADPVKNSITYNDCAVDTDSCHLQDTKVQTLSFGEIISLVDSPSNHLIDDYQGVKLIYSNPDTCDKNAVRAVSSLEQLINEDRIKKNFEKETKGCSSFFKRNKFIDIDDNANQNNNNNYCEMMDQNFDDVTAKNSKEKLQPKTKKSAMMNTENNFECENCSKQFQFKRNLFRHKKFCMKRSKKKKKSSPKVTVSENCISDEATTIKSKTFNCLKCNKGFKKKSLLKNHEKFCRNKLDVRGQISSIIINSVYKCGSCNKTFKRKLVLANHEKNHKVSDENITKPMRKKSFSSAKLEYKCGICGKQCKKKISLMNHIKIHKNK